MLFIDFIRNNKERVIKAARDKKRPVEVDRIIVLDDKRKQLIHSIQRLQEERNTLSKQSITDEVKKRGKEIKESLKQLETERTQIESELNELLAFIPNVPLDEVPVGDNSCNRQIKTWGAIPQFDFSSKSHLELGQDLDIFDLERGSKVAGFRGYFLKNEAAVLHLSLLFYVFMKLVKKGYTPLIAPAIVKQFTLFGSGQLPWGKQEVYQLNDQDAYLAGTAEVPVTAYFSKEILLEKNLPQKLVAISPCFRREAGSYGKDTKGLYRLHEFWKVEQVIIAKNDLEEGKKLHEELQTNTEEILEDLQLPYRVMLMSTEEMGEPQMKKYDTEVWMPSRNAYGEAASNSLMGDFQARRLNIKYRLRDGSTTYCYTLNNTAIASPRILIAILENYQQADASIVIPEILRTLTGFERIMPKILNSKG